jgi:hypothetical protein
MDFWFTFEYISTTIKYWKSKRKSFEKLLTRKEKKTIFTVRVTEK